MTYDDKNHLKNKIICDLEYFQNIIKDPEGEAKISEIIDKLKDVYIYYSYNDWRKITWVMDIMIINTIVWMI